MQVVDVDAVVDGVRSRTRRSRRTSCRLDAAAGQPHGEAVRMLWSRPVAAAASSRRRPAELAAPDDERVVEQARAASGRSAAPAIGWSISRRLRGGISLAMSGGGPTPPAEHLHEPHAALDQAPGDEQLLRRSPSSPYSRAGRRRPPWLMSNASVASVCMRNAISNDSMPAFELLLLRELLAVHRVELAGEVELPPLVGPTPANGLWMFEQHLVQRQPRRS